MTLSQLSIRKPILMSMCIGAGIVFGLTAFLTLPIDLTPNIEFPFVTVQAVYMGAGPEEIETSVIKPIEDQVATVSNIKNITSFCAEGVGFAFIEFNIGTDPDLAAIDVKDKIDAILYRLPRDLLKPVIGKFDIGAQPILDLAVTGPQTPERLRSFCEKQIKDRLSTVPGVASITVSGGREREIQVNMHKEKMDALGLSVMQVAGIIAAQTANIPAGHVTGSRAEYSVRVQGQFASLDEIAALRIPVMSGGRKGGATAWIPLSAIADIQDAYKDVRETARFNRENTVGLGIIKRSDANTVAIARKVKQQLKSIDTTLPQGMKIQIARDRAGFIEQQVRDMYVNIGIGMLLTALMLFVFLGDWRLAMIAAVTIPASLIITFVGMQIFGFTINMMTLIAIGISIGTLVANAIIVLENIARHRDEGMDVVKAAEHGTAEVMIAVVASALTNVAVFVPLANMKGITGQFFKPLGITITLATLISLFLSFTLVPMMASRMLVARRRPKEAGNGALSLADRLLGPLRDGYIAALRVALRGKIAVFLAIAALFFCTLFVLGPRLGFEFFAQSDMGYFTIDLAMPPGTSIAATDSTLMKIEERLARVAEIQTVYATLGGSGTNTGVNYGSIVCRLKDKKDRARSTAQVVKDVRPMVADLPDARLVVKQVSMFGGRSEADLQIEVTGERMTDIIAAADSIKAKMRGIAGLVDIKTSWEEAKPEIKFVPDRMRLDEYGVQVAPLGMALRTALSGAEAAVYRENNDEYKIRVQLSKNDRNTIDAVENIAIPTQKGMTPIKAFAQVKYAGGAANIQRKNRQRLMYVEANVAQGTAGKKSGELRTLLQSMPLPPDTRISFGGQEEMMQESFGALRTAALLAVIITYMVLAASIESLVMPVLIMLTLPLGLIGVIWALFLTENSISMISLMSLIMLIGVVVNNAILLVDYANLKRRAGMTAYDAMIEACRVKFVPIIMMNLAIIISAIPQALARGTISAPFAITAIGGVTVSMLMTYFLIPVMYAAVAPIGRRHARTTDA